MENYNTLLALIAIVCFVVCGVKATLWMDDHFFDPDRTRESEKFIKNFIKTNTSPRCSRNLRLLLLEH